MCFWNKKSNRDKARKMPIKDSFLIEYKYSKVLRNKTENAPNIDVTYIWCIFIALFYK